MYNVVGSPFKMHNSPSGALMFHNSTIKRDMPMVCYGGPRVGNCVYRNNLFIGTAAGYAFESTATMVGCDFDYDGFGGGPWPKFLKWNGIRYDTFPEARQHAPVYRHAVSVNPATAFAGGILQPDDEKRQFDGSKIDLRLKEGSEAVDAGQALAGFNDGFAGAAPDLGAYELGADLPQYGPRTGVPAAPAGADTRSAPPEVRKGLPELLVPAFKTPPAIEGCLDEEAQKGKEVLFRPGPMRALNRHERS
jgi:hypothetical protein